MASLNRISSLTFFLLLVLCLHYSCARNLPLDQEEPDPDKKVKVKSTLSESDSDQPDRKVKPTLSDSHPNDPDSKLKPTLSESDPDDPYNPVSKVKPALSEGDPHDVSIQGGVVIPVTPYSPGCHNTYECQEIFPPPPLCIMPCEPWYGPGPCPCPCEEGAAADMEGIKTESTSKLAKEEGELHGSQTLLSGSSSRTADAPMAAAMMDGSNDHA